MKVYSFYELATGSFTGSHITCPDAWLEQNTPGGCGAMEGLHDPLCRRVNLGTGEVEAYVPDKPADTSSETWTWNAAIERWQSAPTLAALKAQAVDAVMAALERQELSQARAQREVLLALMAGATPSPDAVARLQAVEDNCAVLRGVMASMQAASDKAGLDAVTWSEPSL